ncbi:hypothetical protein BKA56DRAFT_678163 [Ilyonectria sp. MPI-CAGE-AT-0026]|nr:hypothetical protein BKA56DRAFT_678163 [Ilyonectria sp. MPI-CAGE-AT-0026]
MASKAELAIPASQRVMASMSFLSDLKLYLTEKPYFIIVSKDRDSDSVITNIVMDRYRNIPVTDIRGYEHHFTLDIHGFQLARQPTRLHGEDFDSPSMVENKYYPEVEAYLRKFLGAEDVRVMQSAVRERPLEFLETGGGGFVRGDRRKPLPGLHIDASPQGAVKRIQKLWPSEVESITKRRFQILNVWRPLQPCLRDWPLALCDARTVSPDDKVEADLVYPGFEGENTFLYFSPNLDLYFADCQSQDEIWIFKQYDSQAGVANSAPHGSFQNPRPGADKLPRVSIEVAMLVVY